MKVNGKEIAQEILKDIAHQINEQKRLGREFRIVGILVGDSSTGSGQAAKKFLELKKIVAQKVGIEFRIREFPKEISTRDLRKEIVDIARAELNTGIIVELPLPSHINTQYVLNAIPEEKDIDVLSQKSQGVFFTGRSVILPPTVETVKIIFEKYGIDPKGKICAVFGYGLLVGRPICHWLASFGATVISINEHTPEPHLFSSMANIIVTGVGKVGLITQEMIKDKVIVIDFGYTYSGGKIYGDVDFENVNEKAILITPVPGGVGPIVIATVLKNLITLYRSYKKSG